jgi:hypothetical protein
MKIYLSLWLLCVLTACQSKSPAPATTATADQTTAANENIPAITAIKDTLAQTQDSTTNCLNPFLASKRIKSDCTGCDKIMYSFSFVIDAHGKIQTIHKEGENLSCTAMSETDKKKLEEGIVVYMKKQTLPASFYNTTYKGSLGFILKC